MNSALSYTHVNLEELTPVNLFQDYCNINEIRIWPSLVGETKERKSQSCLFSFAVCMGCDGIVGCIIRFCDDSSRGSRKANLFDSSTTQTRYLRFRDSRSLSSVSEILTTASLSCWFAALSSTPKLKGNWGREYRKTIISEQLCLASAHTFTCTFAMLRLPIDLNFLCYSFSKCQAPSQTADSIMLLYFSLTWGPVLLQGVERVAETLSKEALRFPWSQEELTGFNTLQDCV